MSRGKEATSSGELAAISPQKSSRLWLGFQRRVDLFDEIQIDRAQPLLLDPVTRSTQPQLKGFVRSDMRVGSGKNLGQISKPTGDQGQRGRVCQASKQLRAPFHRAMKTART